MISWTSLKMCYVGWKTRSLGEILEKLSVWMTLRKKPYENALWKWENAGIHHFFPFSQCFLPLWETSPIAWSTCYLFMQKVQTDEFKILLFGNTYISQDVGNRLCLVKRLRWATPGPSWPSCLNWQKVLHTGRKHCGKRRSYSLQAISPFPLVFSKDLYCRHIKTSVCLAKG